jgi:hypothetical protein
MAYETQPGTIPHRAVEHLKTLGPGVEVSSAELAALIDVEPTVLVNTLRAAAHHGVVRRRESLTAGGKKSLYWKLGDGKPEPLPHDFEPDTPLRKVTVAAAPSGPSVAAPVPIATRAPSPAPAPISVREYVEKIGPEQAATARPFDAWLSAHDALVLQGITLDEDGDALLQPKHVAALR